MRVADYVFHRLKNQHNIEHVFVIVGGGSMYLNDALKKSGIKYICNHHEQASSFAAEGYARTKNKLAVVSVTTGPGSTNCITGVLSNWTDSIPVLYISGQVKQETTIQSNYDDTKNQIRQLGDQEVDIISIVKPITKYAKTITNPNDIIYEIDRAIDIALSDRPGPVWLNIPIDIQATEIKDFNLAYYQKPCKNFIFQNRDIEFNTLCNAKRPLIVLGHGVRLSNSKKELLDILDYFNCPVVTTFNGFDLIPSNHPLYIGRIGTLGTRTGNIALQSADVILFLGTRNNIRQISYNWENVVKKAIKIVVDIDYNELYKKTIKPEYAINLNISDFFYLFKNFIRRNYGSILDNRFTDWIDWLYTKKEKYENIEYYNKNKYINPYYFVNKLTESLSKNSIVVAGNGTACVTLFQIGVVKKNSRIFWNSGTATMGYALPAAIGASFASYNQPVICITGDGSIQMNIQELQTIKQYDLNISIIVLDNNGYHSIRQTQNNFFNGNFIGCDQNSGLSCMDLSIFERYDFPYKTIIYKNEIDSLVETIKINKKGIYRIILDKDYIFEPKVSSRKLEDGTMVSSQLDDMFPFLSEEELKENRIND